METLRPKSKKIPLDEFKWNPKDRTLTIGRNKINGPQPLPLKLIILGKYQNVEFKFILDGAWGDPSYISLPNQLEKPITIIVDYNTIEEYAVTFAYQWWDQNE